MTKNEIIARLEAIKTIFTNYYKANDESLWDDINGDELATEEEALEEMLENEDYDEEEPSRRYTEDDKADDDYNFYRDYKFLMAI